ncbi:MAG TPA: BMP family ABC transporter substrate-binding protein [Anaerolineaceae bacterium]|nr:BMP family ABC transporter substrate-binding protein [Anaerolineaceae bacterium]
MFRMTCSALFLFVAALLTACAAFSSSTAPVPPSPAMPTTPPLPGGENSAPPGGLRLAAFFPWVIVDGDYNNLGYVALLALQRQFQTDVTYLQSVDPADLHVLMDAMAADGYTVLWAHGSQFLAAALDYARQNPELYVIVENEGDIPDLPPNVWVIDRNFHEGFYVLGALAARASQTGKIGYLGGIRLPFSYIEAHAIEQAVADFGGETEFQAVWTGDLNDADAARRAADRLIAADVDVLLGSLNQGVFGVLEAARAKEGRVLVISKYSDKSSYAPEQSLTSLLYDFSIPLAAIFQRIESGETGGVYRMALGNGISLTPLHNVDPALQAEIEAIIAGVQSGEVKVRQNSTPYP